MTSDAAGDVDPDSAAAVEDARPLPAPAADAAAAAGGVAAASASPRKRRASSGSADSPRKRSGAEAAAQDAGAASEPAVGPEGAAGQQAAGSGPAAAAAAAATAVAGDELPGAEAAAVADGLTPAQRAQIAANRNRALARRAAAEAAQPGAPPLRLSSLLVEPSWRLALAPQLGLPEAAAGGDGGGGGGGRAAGSSSAPAPGSLSVLEPFLAAEWGPGRKRVFPPQPDIFAAFNACPFDQVRVVILGQDPYHGEGQAMGLSFSVPRSCRPLPPSLLNIYKEAQADLGWADRPQHGDLTSWSVQGVLLLNTCLTVRQGEANSHAKRGWEPFSDAAIRALSQRRRGLVFLLWGKPAQTKAALVDRSKHHVLEAAHPSPLSASRGFFGCRHFSAANKLLAAQGLEPIEWRPT
ncbi:hypothetical protein CHLRE_17g746347v5 [Chlamydomonas reinhardtii]|uniref:Uracil-DNA glycosylase n=1 Tax=Chlamydomonas reinhardtii TaxID=3055 RepID=A0A2K3CS29_CHLRE|nr:uncharacterized protein CHLRE_17g746347v5 [Chlamydomonas reinhardtii]PNW71093.1 hypothetical protein CHLRE_17g746347v5 [Chlamydomonas reinhardtii]